MRRVKERGTVQSLATRRKPACAAAVRAGSFVRRGRSSVSSSSRCPAPNTVKRVIGSLRVRDAESIDAYSRPPSALANAHMSRDFIRSAMQRQRPGVDETGTRAGSTVGNCHQAMRERSSNPRFTRNSLCVCATPYVAFRLVYQCVAYSGTSRRHVPFKPWRVVAARFVFSTSQAVVRILRDGTSTSTRGERSVARAFE